MGSIINLKNIGLLFFALTCIINVRAQRYFDERYVYSQSFLNPVLLNPGAIASSGEHSLLVNYRNQWASFPGSPKTVTLSYDGNLADRLGVNVLFLQDNFSSLQTTKGQLGFSYQINSDVNNLGFGLTAEYIRHGLNNFGINSNIGSEDDPIIRARRAGIDYIDASFGVFGIYDKKFTYGIALPSLISSRLDDSNIDSDRGLGFIFNAGYKVKSNSTGISLNPSIWLKKLNNVPTHIDLFLNAGFLDDKLMGGVMYRIGADKNLGFNLGVNVERLGFYYTYNVSNQQYQDYNNGAHEISAKIRLGSSKNGMTVEEKNEMMH